MANAYNSMQEMGAKQLGLVGMGAVSPLPILAPISSLGRLPQMGVTMHTASIKRGRHGAPEGTPAALPTYPGMTGGTTPSRGAALPTYPGMTPPSRGAALPTYPGMMEGTHPSRDVYDDEVTCLHLIIIMMMMMR